MKNVRDTRIVGNHVAANRDDSGDPRAGIERALAEIVCAEERLRRAVRAAREAGLTWADVGDVLGVTRQAAHERFSGRSRL